MKTLTNPRRAMRPPPETDEFPGGCSWCGKPVRRGVVATAGYDLGKRVLVCPKCVAPPAFGDRPQEITTEDD